MRPRLHQSRLLHEAEKQLASTLRSPPIEAKRKLVEVVRQMLVCHCPLVGTIQPPFQKRDDQMHPRQEGGGFFTPASDWRHLVIVSLLLQSRVALPAVGVNSAAGLDALLDERM